MRAHGYALAGCAHDVHRTRRHGASRERTARTGRTERPDRVKADQPAADTSASRQRAHGASPPRNSVSATCRTTPTFTALPSWAVDGLVCHAGARARSSMWTPAAELPGSRRCAAANRVGSCARHPERRVAATPRNREQPDRRDRLRPRRARRPLTIHYGDRISGRPRTMTITPGHTGHGPSPCCPVEADLTFPHVLGLGCARCHQERAGRSNWCSIEYVCFPDRQVRPGLLSASCTLEVPHGDRRSPRTTPTRARRPTR